LFDGNPVRGIGGSILGFAGTGTILSRFSSAVAENLLWVKRPDARTGFSLPGQHVDLGACSGPLRTETTNAIPAMSFDEDTVPGRRIAGSFFRHSLIPSRFHIARRPRRRVLPAREAALRSVVVVLNHREVVMRLNHGERLSLEIGSRMEIELGSPSSRLSSRLVGMDPGAFLIARLPEFEGFEDQLLPGTAIRVSFEYSGNLYGFASSIIDFHSRSLPLLILTYPQAVDRRELRAHSRIDCLFPATARVDATVFQGNVTDISKGGCRFVSRRMSEEDLRRLSMEKHLVMQILLPGDAHPRELKGQVRSVRHDGRNAILGLQFQDPDPELLEKLSDFVDASVFLLK